MQIPFARRTLASLLLPATAALATPGTTAGARSPRPPAVVPVAASVPARQAPRTSADTFYVNKSVPLTVDALNRLTTFWSLFLHEPNRYPEWLKHQRTYIVAIPTSTGQRLATTKFRGLNMVTMAAAYPSIAADLKKAGLTPTQWNTFRNAVLGAAYTEDLEQQGAGTPIPYAVVQRNIALLHAHQAAYENFKAGMLNDGGSD
ncbi:MAG TPA: hypothetical protein VNU46_00260 [Gemmatimonadaceae bacterium]|jgi:hypothetical protein|nr:hypothetical protein [Gemmatimonadaceae bacterium]